MICSRVDDIAVELLDEIKYELRYNEEFKRVYGVLLPLPEERTSARYKKKDSAHIIELENGTAIRSIPWGGNVRGRKRKGYRITLLIGDDPEEVEDLDSPGNKTVEKNLRWLDRSAIPRTDKDVGKIRVVGTRIGQECTIDKLLKRHRWEKKNYRALIDNPLKPSESSSLPIEKRRSVWEDRWSTDYLQKERLEYIAENREEDWMFERQNEPPLYREKSLKGYLYYQGQFYRENEQNLIKLEGYLDPIPVYNYIAIDPAFSEAESADQRALVSFAMGMLPEKGGYRKTCIWVLEYDFNHMDPDQIIERALNLHKRYFYRELTVETNAGQTIYKYITDKTFRQDPFLINYPLSPNYVNQTKNKEDRIYTYFKTVIKLGQLYIRPEMDELRHELDLFLHATHLHLLDALEMGCRFADPCQESVNVIDPKSSWAKRIRQEADYQNANWRLW